MSETTAIRTGEEIDIERLQEYLGEHIGVAFESITVEQFPAGSSNLTYLVRLGPVEYVLRRPPLGNTVRTAHDMHREFEVLSKLSPVYPLAPKPVLFVSDASLIGSEFYLMERRHGLIIRGEIPDMDTHGHCEGDGEVHGTAPQIMYPETAAVTPFDLENSQDARLAVCRSFMANLAELHRLDHASLGLEDLGHIDGYNRRQVEGWTSRYSDARTHDWDALESSIAWLNANIPPESGASLVHNDYKFDNLMLDPADLTRVTAVLDWEMVTIGDPLMDLGTTLGYWMSADAGDDMLRMPFNPRVLMTTVERRELVEMYLASLGHSIPDMLFYYVFGTVKIAVIAQQIFARYAKGTTRDPRFADFSKFVGALGHIAAKAIDRGTI